VVTGKKQKAILKEEQVYRRFVIQVIFPASISSYYSAILQDYLLVTAWALLILAGSYNAYSKLLQPLSLMEGIHCRVPKSDAYKNIVKLPETIMCHDWWLHGFACKCVTIHYLKSQHCAIFRKRNTIFAYFWNFGQLSHFIGWHFSSPEPNLVLCECVGVYRCGRCSTHIHRMPPQR